MENLPGFDIELMNAIGKKLELDIKWVDMSFDGLIPALQSKKIDAAIAGMSITEDRKKFILFSNPYMKESTLHAVLSHKDTQLKNKEELKDKPVGVYMGTTQEGYAKDLGADVKLYNSYAGALLDMTAKKIDAVIIEKIAGDGYVENMEDVKLLDVIEDVTPGMAIALKKDQIQLKEKIDIALEELKADGTYDKIYIKFFPQDNK